MKNRRRAPASRARKNKVGNKSFSTDIKTKKLKEIESGAHFARRIGLPLNCLVTIRHEDIDTLTYEERILRKEADLNRLKQYARDNEFETAFIWSRESERKTGHGEHVHVLIHIPPELHSRFEHVIRRWPANVHVRSDDYNRKSYKWGKIGSAVGYVLKNAPWAAYNTSRMSVAGGPILGKRCGCSRNIDIKAQDKFRSRDEPHPDSLRDTVGLQNISVS